MSCKEGFRTALVGSYGRLCKRVGGVPHGVHASPPAVEGRSRQLRKKDLRISALVAGGRLDAVAGASPYGSAPWIACGGRYALRI